MAVQITVLILFFRFFSGPSTAVVDNADRETASASELKEGTYEFKLTVTDSEGLTGSDAVVVTVKQSKCYVNFSSNAAVTLGSDYRTILKIGRADSIFSPIGSV